MRSPALSIRTSARRRLVWASSLALLAGLLACGGSAGDSGIGNLEGFLVGDGEVSSEAAPNAAVTDEVSAPTNVCAPSDGDESDGDESDGDESDGDDVDDESDGDDIDDESDGDDVDDESDGDDIDDESDGDDIDDESDGDESDGDDIDDESDGDESDGDADCVPPVTAEPGAAAPDVR